MDKFNRGGNRDFGGNRSGGSRFGGRDFKRGGFGGKRFGDRDREVVMHEAVCSACQKTCKVPFQPTGDKPVYCKECFDKRGGPSKPNFNSFSRKDFGNRNDSRPPIRPPFGSDVANNDTKKQLEMINIKLDKLIKTIETMIKPALPEVKEMIKIKKKSKKKVV